MEMFAGFRFLYPQYLFLLPVVGLLGWQVYRFDRLQREKFVRVFGEDGMFRAMEGYSSRRKRVKSVLYLLALVFMALALARPQVPAGEQEVRTQGMDLVFALDISRSMNVEDVVPSRLKKAKHWIRSALDRLGQDRVGLVVFAGRAFAAAPMTVDYDYLKQLLDQIDDSYVKTQGTDLAGALNQSKQLLLKSGWSPEGDSDGVSSAAVIVLSDGEDHEGQEVEMAKELKTMGVRVFSIGLGTKKGGPIPLRDERGVLQGYKRDGSQQPILSRLEEKALEGLASKTGGTFWTATDDEREINDFLSALSGLDRKDGVARKLTMYGERFQIPLTVAALCLLLGLLLGERQFVWRGLRAMGFPRSRSKESRGTIGATVEGKIGVSLLAFLSLLCMAEDSLAERASSLEQWRWSRRAEDSVAKGEWGEAVDHYRKAQAQDPSSERTRFNLGTALFGSGSSEGAIQELAPNLDRRVDPFVAAASAYQLGQVQKKEKQSFEATKSFQKGFSILREKQKHEELSEQERELMTLLQAQLVHQDQKSQQNQQNDQQDQKQQQDQKDQKDQKDEKQSKDQKDSKGQQNQNQNDPQKEKDTSQSENKGGDQKDQKKDGSEKQMTLGPKDRKEFKSQVLSEQDAKRLMQQLKEQENQTQKSLSKQRQQDQERKAGRQRGQKQEDDGPAKDW